MITKAEFACLVILAIAVFHSTLRAETAPKMVEEKIAVMCAHQAEQAFYIAQERLNNPDVEPVDDYMKRNLTATEYRVLAPILNRIEAWVILWMDENQKADTKESDVASDMFYGCLREAYTAKGLEPSPMLMRYIRRFEGHLRSLDESTPESSI